MGVCFEKAKHSEEPEDATHTGDGWKDTADSKSREKTGDESDNWGRPSSEYGYTKRATTLNLAVGE